MATPFKKSSKNIFSLILSVNFLVSILAIILSLILLIAADLSDRAVGFLLGIGFLITGVSTIFSYLKREGAKLFVFNLVIGIIFSLIGLLVAIIPFKSMNFVIVMLGIYLIINGVSKLNVALWLKRGNDSSWSVALPSGILLLVFAIMVFINPFSYLLNLAKLSGVFLLISSFIDLMIAFMLKRRTNEIVKIFW